MKKHGLPTFPIKEGMDIGYERDDDELHWLLQHGYFISSSIAFYQKIMLEQEQGRDGDFVLLKGSHERHLKEHGEEELGRFPTLDKLLKSKKRQDLSLARWQWYEDEA